MVAAHESAMAASVGRGLVKPVFRFVFNVAEFSTGFVVISLKCAKTIFTSSDGERCQFMRGGVVNGFKFRTLHG